MSDSGAGIKRSEWLVEVCVTKEKSYFFAPFYYQ